jgi:polyphosphate glucokinase
MTEDKAPLTLSIDIGGSNVKMLVLDADGTPVTERTKRPTPHPALPEAVISVIKDQLDEHGHFDRISIGFPGVVIDDVVITAVNLHEDWHDIELARIMSDITSVPVRVANDADMQGYGVITGKGVELVITLGTGFGSALFTNGILVPNLELGHHMFKDGHTYEELLGQSARKAVGNDIWNNRLAEAIKELDELFNPNVIYVGGGNAKKIKLPLPEHATITHNIAGILGGIYLWH